LLKVFYSVAQNPVQLFLRKTFTRRSQRITKEKTTTVFLSEAQRSRRTSNFSTLLAIRSRHKKRQVERSFEQAQDDNLNLESPARGKPLFSPGMNWSELKTKLTRKHNVAPRPVRHLARLAFIAFLLTFVISRVCVILIMTRRMPNLFFHAGGTHVHHLNYGIFLLSFTAAVLLFAPFPREKRGLWALLYGLAMGLTFDEFGMWLNLGGSYWQRASFDGVIVVLTAFGLIAFAPRWERVRSHHFVTGGILLVVIASFYLILFKSLRHANEMLMPKLIEIEQTGPR
jgi:hypothetical protein